MIAAPTLTARETPLAHAFEWVQHPAMWRGIHLGCNLPNAAIGPAGDGELCAVQIVDSAENRECGVVLFEQRTRGSWAQVIPHLALRTFGSRTALAFRLALEFIRERGAREAVYMFSSVNTPVYALLRRMGLLTHYCLAAQEGWMRSQWFVGRFQL